MAKEGRGNKPASEMTIRERMAIYCLQGYNARPELSPLIMREKYERSVRDADKLLEQLNSKLPPENKPVEMEPNRIEKPS